MGDIGLDSKCTDQTFTLVYRLKISLLKKGDKKILPLI